MLPLYTKKYNKLLYSILYYKILYFGLKYFRVRTRNFQAVILYSYSGCESFCHKTDPKETKSINRFRKKDTFTPDKHTDGVADTLCLHESNSDNPLVSRG